MLYKMRYILWLPRRWRACDVIQGGRHFGRHLGFYWKLGIVKKRLKCKIFDAGHGTIIIVAVESPLPGSLLTVLLGLRARAAELPFDGRYLWGYTCFFLIFSLIKLAIYDRNDREAQISNLPFVDRAILHRNHAKKLWKKHNEKQEQQLNHLRWP